MKIKKKNPFKISKILFIFASILIFLLVVLIVYALSSYRINNGTAQTINEWGTCRRVTNSAGADIFVPTNTLAEWNSFISNHPPAVSVGSCCGDGSCNNGAGCDTCPADCGVCTYCGDGGCNNVETCSSCPVDCGTCPDNFEVWGSCNFNGNHIFCDGSLYCATGYGTDTDRFNAENNCNVQCGGLCGSCMGVGCGDHGGCNCVQ